MVARGKGQILPPAVDFHSLRLRCQPYPPDEHSIHNRLTKYFNRVRFLELENKRLTKKVEIAIDCSNIKTMYESELAKVRKALDETASEKAKLQMSIARLAEENEHYKQLLQSECNEPGATHAKEQFYRSIQTEYDSVCVTYKKTLDNSPEMQDRMHQLKGQLNEISKALEIETSVHNNNNTQNAVQKFRRELASHSRIRAKRPGVVHPKWQSITNFPAPHTSRMALQSNNPGPKTDALRAENEKLKFIIADSEAQLRAEKRRNGELESETEYLHQNVMQLHQKSHDSSVSVQVSFDDQKFAIKNKMRQMHQKVSNSIRAANGSSKSIVVHQYHHRETRMNGQRRNQRVSIGCKQKRTEHMHIGRKPTNATNKWTVCSRIALSFQRLKTVLKLEFDKIKETCMFFESKRIRKIYFLK